MIKENDYFIQKVKVMNLSESQNHLYNIGFWIAQLFFSFKLFFNRRCLYLPHHHQIPFILIEDKNLLSHPFCRNFDMAN